MPWLQIHVETGKEHAAHAEALLESLGALSVTVEDAADEALLEPAPGETPLWKLARITGLFDADVNAPSLANAVSLGLDEPSARVRTAHLEDQEWERAWMDHFRPMRFGRRLWVCPRDSEPPGEAEHATVLRLDPGLAFGTGTHESTALCLRWIDGASLTGKTVIDYGCGSGILAIAALLLGARHVTAIDHDPQALTAARENAVTNNVANRLELITPDQSFGITADIVIANILAGTLIDLASSIAGHARTEGELVLAGILSEQAPLVENAYRPMFVFDPPVTEKGWVMLHASKTR